MTTKAIALIVSAISALGWARTAGAQEPVWPLSAAADEVSSVIRSGDLSRLRPLIADSRITFDADGEMNEGVRCFLRWDNRCPTNPNSIGDILSREHFHFYYHLDERNVIVSYVRKDSRGAFDQEPLQFLQDRYLKDYFSCQFVLVDGKWMLTESVCFSETEAPFSPDPEV